MRLSYSNVTATLALVIAVGGGTAIAINGGDADSVNGVKAAKIDFVTGASGGPSKPLKTIFKQGGLVLRARCYEQSGHFLDLFAKSRKNNAEIQVAVVYDTANPRADRGFDRGFDKGDSLEISSLGIASQGEVTLTYSTPKGSHVSAVFQMDVGAIFDNILSKDCLVGGTATHVPP